MISLFRNFFRDTTSGKDSGKDSGLAEMRPEDRDTSLFDHLPIPIAIPSSATYPVRDVWPMFPPGAVMRAHQGRVQQGLDVLQGTSMMPNFQHEFGNLIFHFAAYVSMLPASKAYHHSQPGGLFAHSLDVAAEAAFRAGSRLVTQDSTPRNRESDRFAWRLTAYICGLLHDIGKIETLGTVEAASIYLGKDTRTFHPVSSSTIRPIWCPAVEPLWDWHEKNRVAEVTLEFAEGEWRNHEHYLARYFFQIVPRSMLAYIYGANPRIKQLLEDYLRNPLAGSTEDLPRAVKDADALSVAYDTNPNAKKRGVDVASIVGRCFAEYAAERSWNTPSSYFQRAHLLVDDDESEAERYVDLSFFVLTDESIDQFVSYILKQERYRVSLHEPMEQTVLEALEAQGLLFRSIPPLLTDPVRNDSIPKYNPASIAQFLFPANSVRDRIAPETRNMPLRYQLPVAAVGDIGITSRTEHMPTLSFIRPPSTMPSKSLPLRVTSRGFFPSEAALDRDREIMKEIEDIVGPFQGGDDDQAFEYQLKAMKARRQIKARLRETGASGALLPEISSIHDETPEPVSPPPSPAPVSPNAELPQNSIPRNSGKDSGRATGKGSGKGNPRPQPGQTTAPVTAPATRSRSAKSTTPTELPPNVQLPPNVPPELAPKATVSPQDILEPWVALFSANPQEKSRAVNVVGAYWLWLRSTGDVKHSDYVDAGNGQFRCAFTATAFNMTLRRDFKDALKSAGLSSEAIGPVWDPDGLTAAASGQTLRKMDDFPEKMFLREIVQDEVRISQETYEAQKR